MPARNITAASFDSQVLHSSLPVLVDFWQPGCPPCAKVGPIIDELADEFAGVVKVCKVNIAEDPSIARQLGIRSVPTVMLLVGGQLVQSLQGAQTAGVYRRMVRRG
mgnify:CR=1 FL=1